MQIQLSGKNAVVTGGTRGIGRAIVLTLAKAGAQVLTCYRQEGEAAESLARELKETGGQHHLVQADVSTDLEHLVEEIRTRLGTVDVLVNSAGVISHVPFEELPLDEWSRVLDNNLTAVFRVIQQTLPVLGDGASIVNVGSRVAAVGVPLRAHYTASKAGIVGLSRSLCKELGERGIRVNVVAPGVIDTVGDALSAAEREKYEKRYKDLMALGRFGRPEEVAAVVSFLASDLAGYITGDTIHVDGGI